MRSVKLVFTMRLEYLLGTFTFEASYRVNGLETMSTAALVQGYSQIFRCNTLRWLDSWSPSLSFSPFIPSFALFFHNVNLD